MKIYLAPLEGVTGYTYRRALQECFSGFDKYFIPFILPNQKGHLSTREKKDIAPENNQGIQAVPQILTKNAEDFIRTVETLKEYGKKKLEDKKIVGWRCKICDYIYEGSDLPAEFTCPLCGHGADDFEPIYES